MPDLPPSAVRVAEAAAALGLAIEVVEFPEGTRTADDAARAVGCDVGQIVKSLAFAVDGTVVLAMVSGSNRLDEKKLSAVAGGGKVTRADADAVRAATGYAVGGVPPFGHDAPLPTFVDTDLLAHDVVWAAAGTPHHVFAVDPNALVAATGPVAADLAAR
jgi:Cys-tRNA(Pro) deacylase